MVALFGDPSPPSLPKNSSSDGGSLASSDVAAGESEQQQRHLWSGVSSEASRVTLTLTRSQTASTKHQSLTLAVDSAKKLRFVHNF
mmetsp:Transcript_26078/g.77195  ORF Transcript_26078/g.77195 Transcript_26078/m.77195 type:complete len:86 (-) Transcript_26078:124-381(-)